MARTAWARLLALILVASVGLRCHLGLPYTHSQALDRIHTVCRDKYHLDVTTRILGDTLYATMELPGLLQRLSLSGAMAHEDMLKIGDLLQITTHISLSTQPLFQFYVLRLFDPEFAGSELRYVTYLDDVRRLYAQALAEVEFFDRRIQDLKLSGDQQAMSDPWMDREVALGEFLAVQLALRLKAMAFDEKSALARWGVEDCAGWFEERAFRWLFSRRAAEESDDTTWPAEIFRLVARVLREYRFDDYRTVAFTDLSTLQTRELTPDELATFYVPR